MTDTTLNQFISSGTAAERGAFTPAPATPAAGNDPSYIWLETDTGDVYMWDFGGSAWVLINSGSGSTPAIVPPQGRLTLTTATPIMSADATAQTSVYYTPHIGEYVPLYGGSSWAMHEFAELTMALDTSNQLSGSLYDLFIWNNSGTIALGAGPAWSSTTARGTGAGTTELERKDGLWTNKVSITLKNGAGSGTSGIAANTALYVGTIYCTANGQTGMAFAPTAASGGNANILGVFNAYNRVPVLARSADSTVSWTYNSGTFRSINNSTSNRVSYVDGLGVLFVSTRITVLSDHGSNYPAIGVVRDSTSATPFPQGNHGGSSGTQQFVNVANDFVPSLGFHYLQGVEARSAGAGSYTFYAEGKYQAVAVRLEL